MLAPALPPASAAQRRFLLGIPRLSEGPLLAQARALGAPILLSANSFSRRIDRGGWKEWTRFAIGRLPLLDGMDASLDSAGFVAMTRYGGYDWSVDAYLDLCAAWPWRWFAAMDYCCEEEIAPDRDEVLDRVSQTIFSLGQCLRGARERGIEDRLMPVVQGRKPADYARCLDRMPIDFDALPLLGVGSICRRAIKGPEGVLAVVDRIHDELGASPARLHLFGVKSEGISALRGHPRVESFDSQSYGTRARKIAKTGGFPKTAPFVAGVMRQWYLRQIAALDAPPVPGRPRQVRINFPEPEPDDEIGRKVARAREQMRVLVENGEMDATSLTDLRALEWAFDDDDGEEGD